MTKKLLDWLKYNLLSEPAKNPPLTDIQIYINSHVQKEDSICASERKLEEKNITFRLLYPTTFSMDLVGEQSTFTRPKAADNSLKKYLPDMLPQH